MKPESSLARKVMLNQDTSESDAPNPELKETAGGHIVDLLGAFQLSSARKTSLIFVGLTRDGLPMSTTDRQLLSQTAERSLQTFEKSGLRYPVCPFADPVPVVFRIYKLPRDFQDEGRYRRAKDILRYGAVNKEGQMQDLEITELDILNAIANAPKPWQDSGRNLLGDDQTDTTQKYTLFLRDGSSEFTLIFAPKIRGESNYDSYRNFIIGTVAQLLYLDSKQQTEDQKGYIDIVEKYKSLVKKPKGFLSNFIELEEGTKWSDLLWEIDTGEAKTLDIEKLVKQYKLDQHDLATLLEMASELNSQAIRVFRA